MFSHWHMIIALWPCRRCSCRRLKICKVCKVINLIAGVTVSHNDFFYQASPKTYLQLSQIWPSVPKDKTSPSSKQVLAQDFLSPASKELALHFWKVKSHLRQMNLGIMAATFHPKAWPLLPLVWSEVPVEGGGASNDLLGLCFTKKWTWFWFLEEPDSIWKKCSLDRAEIILDRPHYAATVPSHRHSPLAGLSALRSKCPKVNQVSVLWRAVNQHYIGYTMRTVHKSYNWHRWLCCLWLDKSLVFLNNSDAIMSPPSSLARQIHLGSDHGRDHCRNAATPSAKMLWWFPPLWATSPSLAEPGSADCWQPEKVHENTFFKRASFKSPPHMTNHNPNYTFPAFQSDQACFFDKHMAETRTHP